MFVFADFGANAVRFFAARTTQLLYFSECKIARLFRLETSDRGRNSTKDTFAERDSILAVCMHVHNGPIV